MTYVERTYRDLAHSRRWTSFTVCEGQTDLYIKADRDLSVIVLQEVLRLRGQIEAYIEESPFSARV